jgi:hypothetical protein
VRADMVERLAAVLGLEDELAVHAGLDAYVAGDTAGLHKHLGDHRVVLHTTATFIAAVGEGVYEPVGTPGPELREMAAVLRRPATTIPMNTPRRNTMIATAAADPRELIDPDLLAIVDAELWAGPAKCSRCV